jgi:hypothetical protein
LGKSGASLIFRRSSVVVNLGLGSLSKSSSNAQIKAEVKEAFPGLLVVPLGEVAARYSNDLNSSLAFRSTRSPGVASYLVLRPPPNRPRSPA